MLKKKRKSNLSQLTSWVQPLDQGIIRAVKAEMRRMLNKGQLLQGVRNQT